MAFKFGIGSKLKALFSGFRKTLDQSFFDNLEDLVHKYKIGDRTLAEIICDENNIPRTVLPVKRPIEKWQSDFFEGNGNDSK